MKFNEYPYIRPQAEVLKGEYKKHLELLNNAKSVDDVVNTIESMNKIKMEFDSYASICSVRHSINTKDEFYEKEREYFDETFPIVEEDNQKFAIAIFNSPFKKELIKIYGDHYFKLIEISLKTFNPLIIEDIQIENKLITEYGKLKASAQIDYNEKILTLPQMSPYLQDLNREVRKSAEKAVADWYTSHEKEFDDIYDGLVKIRTTIAKKLGFKDFTELAYARLGRTDYNAEMVANYRKQVYQDLVPVAEKLIKLQAKRLNIKDLKSYDLNISFMNGNPMPIGDTMTKVNNANKMYHEMSKETGVFFDYMVDHELFDLDSKPGKEGGGYCTYIPKFDSPFIFSNFNKTGDDINVLTHEAGHAFQVFSSRKAILPEYIWPTLEACEIHSMSMEFFAWPWMDLFFGEGADKYRFSHLEGTITFIPYGVAVDEFQHEIYANPDLTPNERKSLWRSIEKKYLPYKIYDDENLNRGIYWFRQGHIFQSPFYYIDYTLAQVCAQQFWVKNQENHEQAWQEYYQLCCAGGSKSFLNLLPIGNLLNPFIDGTIKATISKLDEWLDNFDQELLK